MTDATHAALMDATYRHQRRIYDVTRRHFLLGRDRLIAELDPPPGARVLEIACGTGRNLDLIGRRWPGCRLSGLDISQEMLASARARLGRRATLALGDATRFEALPLFGTDRFERIVLSYALSMIPDWREALREAALHLVPGGGCMSSTSAIRRACPAGPAPACAAGSGASTSRRATIWARHWAKRRSGSGAMPNTGPSAGDMRFSARSRGERSPALRVTLVCPQATGRATAGLRAIRRTEGPARRARGRSPQRQAADRA